VWTWGFHGDLGYALEYWYSPEPRQVPGLTGVTALAASGNHVHALRADGTAMGWGFNWYGVIGDGTSPVHLTPVRVALDCRLTALPAWEQGQGTAQRCQAR